tara:strand:- start:20676 stop:21755 length:1080 start_codon:yes stop_codon:yes gene_type:complete
VGYYDGKMNKFIVDKSGALCVTPTINPDKKYIVVIVARNCYHEKSETYPIDNKRELNNLLRLEYAQSDNSLYYIWGMNNGQNEVNIWQFNDDVPATFLRLPETFLFSKVLIQNQIIEIKPQHSIKDSVYISRNGKLIYSANKSDIIDSPQRFSLSVGCARVESDFIIQPKQFTQTLASALMKQSPGALTNFIKLPRAKSRFKLLANIILPLFITVSSYLALSSAYLSYKHNDLQEKLANQSEEISLALKEQDVFEQYFARYGELTKFFASQGNVSPFWFIIADVFPQVHFSNIRFVDNRYVLKGSTDNAVGLLEKISKDRRVKGAQFDYPTTKNRNKDVFVISFILLEKNKIESRGDEV